MRVNQNKVMKIAACGIFAAAMTLNLSSNIAGELTMKNAYAEETGATTAKKVWSSQNEGCEGTRICKGKSVGYTGLIFKCIPGTYLVTCDDSKSSCVPKVSCPN